MKVLVVGEQCLGGHVGMIYKSLQELGISVELVSTNSFFKLSLANRIISHFLRTPFYFGSGMRTLNEELVDKARANKFDFILFFKPIIIYPKTIIELKKHSKVFSWYPDYALFPKTASTLFYKTIPLYDCHFSFNFANVGELTKLGAKKSIFLPCAADTSCHHHVDVTKEEATKIGADIVFIGTYADDKRFEYLEKLCADGYYLKVYGNSWNKCSTTSCLYRTGAIQFKEVCCEDMGKVFSSSKIALSFVREHNDETLACRSFEIPACGAFMLHQRTEKIGEYFKEGKEAEFFGSYEEMKSKIDYYLTYPAERAEISKRGMERVLKGGNLMIDRVREIIEFYKKSALE